MTRVAIVLTLLMTFVFTSLAVAADFKGVTLPDSYSLEGQTLQLNGQGMRSKFSSRSMLVRSTLRPK